ncbi:hypothetical protein [Candidatus Synchoanobacter obligatus]|uniref:Uncharacterized protein n=1 Tax=Candidatus Synchoanobacter obligatus TaxID=2919597 RepID=A0ABT1L4D5_9GAMM|nr:hypothetical protein [Candidatus Synchoanobacter obligatus]MCP8352034.1 hypothetical protein [Candidatus Synchoanobacter obligatus]
MPIIKQPYQQAIATKLLTEKWLKVTPKPKSQYKPLSKALKKSYTKVLQGKLRASGIKDLIMELQSKGVSTDSVLALLSTHLKPKQQKYVERFFSIIKHTKYKQYMITNATFKQSICKRFKPKPIVAPTRPSEKAPQRSSSRKRQLRTPYNISDRNLPVPGYDAFGIENQAFLLEKFSRSRKKP